MMIEQESKDGKDVEEVNRDVSAHMTSFFLDMYETTSSVLSFVVYNLSRNEDVQGRVREEVRAAVKKSGGALTIETINDMTCMDRVIDETLRLDPITGSLTKICTERIELFGSDGLRCVVEPGIPVYVPMFGLHSDPVYWENPRKFDPERFTPEAVNSRHKFVYIPFNEGPRQCPGRRIARTVMKLALSMILMKYSIEMSEKTRFPLEYATLSFLTHASDGLWVKMKPL